jgi:hypothetical protein
MVTAASVRVRVVYLGLLNRILRKFLCAKLNEIARSECLSCFRHISRRFHRTASSCCFSVMTLCVKNVMAVLSSNWTPKYTTVTENNEMCVITVHTPFALMFMYCRYRCIVVKLIASQVSYCIMRNYCTFILLLFTTLDQ